MQVAAALGPPAAGRCTLIAESDLNDPHLVTPREAGGYGLDAQWSDDFHHAVHVALTGETEGYYADFEPLAALAKVCEHGFFHDGTWSSFRGRDARRADRHRDDARRGGSWSATRTTTRSATAPAATGSPSSSTTTSSRCAALLTLTGPFTPMLFQGEEWAASTPFAFFTSHPEAELGRAVTEGRVGSSRGWRGTSARCPTRRTRRRSSVQARLVRGWSADAVCWSAPVVAVLAGQAPPALTDPAMRRPVRVRRGRPVVRDAAR